MRLTGLSNQSKGSILFSVILNFKLFALKAFFFPFCEFLVFTLNFNLSVEQWYEQIGLSLALFCVCMCASVVSPMQNGGTVAGP